MTTIQPVTTTSPPQVKRVRKPVSKLKRDEAFASYLFIAPMVILTIVFVIYPIFGSIRFSLYNWNGIGNPTQYVGLRHFETVATDPWFWNAFRNTVVYTAVLVPLQLSLALMLAMVLNNPKFRLRTLFRTVYFLPVVTSAAVVAVVIRLMLGNFGTGISELLNIRPALSPIASPQLALLSVIAFGTWHTFGINLIYFIAALQTVPEELYDAAKVDGANWLQQIMYVTIPGIRPVATIILFFAILGSLRVFEASFVLTGGGPYFASEVVSGYIFGYAFSSGGEYGSGGPANLGYASAAAFFFSILILGITLLQLIMTRRLGKATEDQ